MSIEEKEEWKLINDLAIQAGRALQSSQTGLVHYCMHATPEEIHHTIPVYENLLFSLALMRSRTGDAITEGKGILERMLSFQTAEGAFPIYVHEYSHCRDRFIGAYLLPPLYWILIQFHAVLGNDTKSKLEEGLKRLLDFTLRTQASFDIPPHLIARISGASIALGKHWKDTNLIAYGERLLETLPKEPYASAWASPNHIGDLLTALQLVYPSLHGTPWEKFLNQLGHSWHPLLGASLNPGMKELQAGNQPQPTLNDLWMGYLTKNYSKRAKSKLSFQLQGALIHSSDDHIGNGIYPFKDDGVIENQRYLVRAFDRFAYTAIETTQELHPAADRGKHPLRVIWGDTHHCHTLVAEGGNVGAWTFKEIQHGIELTAKLGDPIEDDDREKNREIVLFCDLHENLKFLVSGIPASTFKLGDEIELQSPDFKAKLRFDLMEGNGHFIGHLMRGNRPSQVSDNGANRFTAYDQQIYLRTLRRSHPCSVRIRLTF